MKLLPSKFRLQNFVRTRRRDDGHPRRGSILTLSGICLVGIAAFVAFAVDIGLISLTKMRMQTCADATALAAAMEVAGAIESAGDDVQNVWAYAQQQARLKAEAVAAANGFYVDPNRDVIFGRRTYDGYSGTYSVEWNVSPSNTVKVIVRKDNEDVTAPDGKLQLMFAPVFGADSQAMRADAAAFVDPRDIVTVVDFSGSMSHSSQFKSRSINSLGQTAIEQNLQDIYLALQPLDIGLMEFAPDHLTMPAEVVYSVDPVVDLTFQYNKVFVQSDSPYNEIRLVYADGHEHPIDAGSVTSGTYQGSDAYANADIKTAWVKFAGEEVTLEGSDTNPFITVTFSPDRTSVFIESTKDISNVVLEFMEDGVHQRFEDLPESRTGTFAGTGEYSGKMIGHLWVKSGTNASTDMGYGEKFDTPLDNRTLAYEFKDTNANVMAVFGLNDVPYPFPSGSWDQFINYARTDSDLARAGFREMYGGMAFVHYLMEIQPSATQTPTLWKTPQYPLQAVKTGHTMLANYIQSLSFGDYLGLVSYDSLHRVEDFLDDGHSYVDLTGQPVTDRYIDLDTILQHKQAAHYYSATNIGGGLMEARQLLQTHGRSSARPTILLMTDGVPTAYGDYTIPADFSWKLIDYDHDQAADYSIQGSDPSYDAKMYAITKAFEARQAGITIHTLTVGDGADQDLMRAIAHLGGGKSHHVPDGLSGADFEAAVGAALQRLSAVVPPPRLLRD